MNIHETFVCIVGAGPAGLVTALGLARAGVPFVLLDDGDGPVKESRGLVVHAGALEVLDELGVAAELLERGTRVGTFRVAVRGHALMHIPLGTVPTAFPYFLIVAQAVTESVLRDRLAAQGHAILSGHRVTGVRQDGDGCEVTGKDAQGRPFAVRARCVAGADGLHSTVREQLGIGFPQHTYDTAFLTADVELTGGPDRALAHITPSRHGLLFMAPMPGGGWRLIISVRSPGGRRPQPPALSEVQAHLRRRGLPHATVTTVHKSAGVLLHHGLADDFGRGLVALAGDAAHVHSPAGGMGMNTGIQDACDLAATLAAVHGGADADTMLAGYRRRRMAAAGQVVGFTDRLMRLVSLDTMAVHVVRTAAFALAGLVPAIGRRAALMVSCVTRTPAWTGAPRLPAP
ncbi:pentachlorophenol monooxygenase [Nonomuraea sp. FMUSA5-5]|uniref:Pentachlorophenol monooxygenase n=1 Tax=Nonomuraea composti TaxID=2720023 RepID=A0ABX1BEN9_9ACTN|nr:FAD-dependent monooxygenase [Nonomuraea sp. FMUSA5-5]NJP94827.1 pentachlorophenol monooxygenase [Nonomuraea sp. FMUSA5-5]